MLAKWESLPDAQLMEILGSKTPLAWGSPGILVSNPQCKKTFSSQANMLESINKLNRLLNLLNLTIHSRCIISTQLLKLVNKITPLPRSYLFLRTTCILIYAANKLNFISYILVLYSWPGNSGAVTT